MARQQRYQASEGAKREAGKDQGDERRRQQKTTKATAREKNP
jgi:hypothetical protein